jgi:hypothetical protein
MNRHSTRFSPALMRRFLQHNREYISAVVREAESRERGEILTLEEYRKLRRDNSGVIIAFDFIEVSLGLNIPDEVREDASFQQIFYAALDMINFSNVNDQISIVVDFINSFLLSGRVVIQSRVFSRIGRLQRLDGSHARQEALASRGG